MHENLNPNHKSHTALGDHGGTIPECDPEQDGSNKLFFNVYNDDHTNLHENNSINMHANSEQVPHHKTHTAPGDHGGAAPECDPEQGGSTKSLFNVYNVDSVIARAAVFYEHNMCIVVYNNNIREPTVAAFGTWRTGSSTSPVRQAASSWSSQPCAQLRSTCFIKKWFPLCPLSCSTAPTGCNRW